MWPWEHLAVAYLAYSALVHARTRDGPTAAGTVAVGVGSQFPDLVDKPLAWQFGLLPAGWSLTHSLLVAVPLSIGVLLVARRLDRLTVGTAFVVGYLLHLPGDVLYGVLLGGEPAVWFLAWPLVPAPPQSSTPFVPRAAQLLARFVQILSSPRGAVYLLGELALMGGATAVWIVDGTPPFDVARPGFADRHSR